MTPMMKSLLNIAWSLMLMMAGVALGLTLYPILCLGKTLAWSFSNASTAWMVVVALGLSVYFSFAYERWTGKAEPDGERSAGESARSQELFSAPRFERFRVFFWLPFTAFMCSSAAMGTASVFGLVLDGDLVISLPFRLAMGFLLVSGGAVALLVTIWVMITWLRELDALQDRTGEDRSNDATPAPVPDRS